MARVSLLEKHETDPVLRELFDKMENSGGRIINLFKALAHSPRQARDFLRLGIAILAKGELDHQLRELVILRVGHLAGSDYEWAQHEKIAAMLGMDRQKVLSVREWEKSPLFDEKERAALAYADEVAQNIRVPEEVFKDLEKYFSQQEIVELTLAVGYYGMVARVLEALEIELEEN